ncbi:MAG TPA: hypothetical protein VHG51_06690 [Longimicrobiaceae bacterium]|nr:hypothetical protein [Longimicrobiaceae bacterium]
MAKRGGGGLFAGLLLLGLLAGGAWLFRDQVARLLGREEPVATLVSPEAAAQAEAKLERLTGEGETIRLNDVEFTSLMRYRMRDRIPGDFDSPAVAFRGDTVRLMARVPSDRLPRVGELGAARAFLPDTADVDIVGHLGTLQPGRAAFEVRRITFAGIPVPDRLYPQALESMGRREEPGLGPTAFPFPLPDGVGTARVEEGMLVLSPA